MPCAATRAGSVATISCPRRPEAAWSPPPPLKYKTPPPPLTSPLSPPPLSPPLISPPPLKKRPSLSTPPVSSDYQIKRRYYWTHQILPSTLNWFSLTDCLCNAKKKSKFVHSQIFICNRFTGFRRCGGGCTNHCGGAFATFKVQPMW